MNMHIDIGEIIDAWIAATRESPDSPRRNLAGSRLEFCNSCKYLKMVGKIPVCGECGCPIAKKVFSKYENPCPKKKWLCDRDYFEPKQKSSLL